jgi:hypothetical protein
MHQDISGVDATYWEKFRESRRDLLEQVAESLTGKLGSDDLDEEEARQIPDAHVSISAARHQLELIDPEVCQKFIDLWQADLAEWRRYLTKLPHLESIESALDHLGLDYAPRTR